MAWAPRVRGSWAGPRVLALLALAALATAFSAVPAAGSTRPDADAAGARYAGWATIAYPSMSAADLRGAFARQQAAGANLVWLGHNNPGEVDANTAEPGLSYSVFVAFTDRQHPRHADARAIVQAQLRALSAARALGLKVVLPIGYQLHMGADWHDAHPDDLRRNYAGDVSLDTGVVNATIYSPRTRADLQRYYEWVHVFFVRPYRQTILMLNLADEPSGSDYSPWAERVFAERTGHGFADVGDDPARQAALGRFLSGYIVDYARWAAEQWQRLEPGLPVTMSFEGATARLHLQLPRVESLFADTPPNFVPTFDAYPRDGPPEAIIDDSTLVQLFTLVRSLGHYSAKHDRPFWLWSAANSWGLAQASPRPAHVADAVANAYYLALLARQTGGLLQGIAVWNYNAKGQGLYNDTHRTTYEPDTMFARVSESLPRVRQLLAAPPGSARVLVLAPDGLPHRLLGSGRGFDQWSLRAYHFDRLLALARNNVPAAVVSTLAGENLDKFSAVIVLARDARDLPAAERERLQAFAARGRPVVAHAALRLELGGAAHYVLDERVEDAFADSPSREHAALWRLALDVTDPIQAYYVATGEDALFYTLQREPLTVYVRLPFSGQGWVAETNGSRGRPLHANGDRLEISLRPNQYAYVSRAGQ